MRVNLFALVLALGAGGLWGCAESCTSGTNLGISSAGAAANRAVIAESKTKDGQTAHAGASQTVVQTDAPLDLRIDGPGYFKVVGASGAAYTRCGRFTLDGDGGLVLAAYPPMRLEPVLVVPCEATGITIDNAGLASCTVAGSSGVSIFIGRVRMTTFPTPEELKSDGVYLKETAKSGAAKQEDFGATARLIQGSFEGSRWDRMVAGLQLARAQQVFEYWANHLLSQALPRH